MLHEAHIGMSRMKAQARSWVWWPGMDSEIENSVRSCYTCQTHSKSPPKAPLFPWEWPQEPWSRLHLDFAGPFLGKMFLVLVDAHSKWVDIKIMSRITAPDTTLELRDIFSTFGACSEIVTDNGPTFTSEFFKKVLSCNGVEHITVSPYHPSSNGLAERYVQEFKSFVITNQHGSLRERVIKFLTKSRSLPHSTTGVSPAELMFGRKMKTHLDLLHPTLHKKVTEQQMMQKHQHDKNTVNRDMSVGDSVFTRNFSNQGNTWIPGTVSEKTGTYSYRINTPNNGVVRRHIDHIRNAGMNVSEAITDGSDTSAASAPIIQTPVEVVNSNPLDGAEALRDSEPKSVPTTPLRRSGRESKPVVRLDL